MHLTLPRSPVRRRRQQGLGQRAFSYASPSQKLLRTSYRQGKVRLPEFRDAGGQVVARYAAPDPKVLGTAYVPGQATLPSFYRHPTLGPWGVDPLQAYQYWAAQQAAMRAIPFMTPMTVWGSPGVTARATPGLQRPSLAQQATFDPYSQAFPPAGTAVERF
jgi:hypothetical protein